MVLVHAELKLFHSFVPDDCPNPLDNACCKNLIECAKRTRSNPINKKSPLTLLSLEALLTGMALRKHLLSSLGFTGVFRFNELDNIQPKHLAFCYGFVKMFVPRSKSDAVYREGNYAYIAKLALEH